MTIRSLMQLSGAVVDLLDAQGSSVCLSLEDGWDVTAQVHHRSFHYVFDVNVFILFLFFVGIVDSAALFRSNV